MTARLSVTAFLAFILAFPAGAAEPVSRDDLEKALEQRDRVIEQLQRRLDALESARPAPEAPAPAATAPAAEEDVALQALSRTLVARGALLLPEGTFELSPEIAYSHTQTDGLVVVPTGVVNAIVDRRLRDDSLQAVMAGRLGLPWLSQVEVRLPYAWRRETVAFGNGVDLDRSSYHLGDVEVELGRQLMREHGWWPDMLAAVDVRFPTGSDPYRTGISSLANGTGFYGLRGRVTAVKSQDPLAFFGTLAYTMSRPEDKPAGHIDPGEIFDITFGTVLAASPSTSLTLGLVNDFTGRTSVNGTSLPGSDRVASVLQIGAAAVIARNILANLTVGAGLTRDAPDFQILLSTPIRF